ncbi:hypothetical protein [Nocardia miyunensis]|uniref:hypothetical protein n=1 Tax=Nocardia miyunensis TaxID=282684 RepID=UPI0008297F37|nr:hypothetical protein [Nocardia miyunensis]
MNHPRLNDREITTILAALRQFQCTPIHSSEHFVDTTPLASEEIDTLCERINSIDPTHCRTDPADAARSLRPQFATAGVQLDRVTAAIYGCTDCSCLFVPETDADTIYPDRAVIVGMSGHPDTDHDCRCHTLPYEWVPADGN